MTMNFINLLFVFFTLLELLSSFQITPCFAQIGRKELRRPKEANMKAVIQLNRSVQRNRVDPSRVIQLSWRPRVFLYSGFLSDAECDHLISLARGKQEDSFSNDGDSGSVVIGRPFLSHKALLNIEDKVTASIEKRISAWTFLPKENSKSIQIMHFGVEEASQKYNFFSNKPELGLSVPLVATVVLFLSNVTRGGDIIFPESKVKDWSDCTSGGSEYGLTPIKGNAILFFNLHPNALPDKSSSHGRCPVLDGEMWCATKYFHVRPVNESNMTEESAGNECTDEDGNCSRWAAAGECQRNPVYMIGSPDYYGTCRKSCNAC